MVGVIKEVLGIFKLGKARLAESLWRRLLLYFRRALPFGS
jgi:hypothetical protein